jgi:hypothetical protein
MDLPALKAILSNQKSTAIVRQSRELAESRQDRTLLRWLDGQQLTTRAQVATRLLKEAEELLTARVAAPILESQLPRLMNDAGYQLSIEEPVVNRRLSHWPLVNVIQTALLPLMAVIQKNVANGSATLQVQVPALQGAFALLHQSHPTVASLYAQRRLWEDLPACESEADLQSRLAETIERQLATALDQIGHPSILFAPIRWLLTIGALIWFPIAQPILQAMLAPTWTGLSRDFALLAVQLLSAAYLLKSAGILIIYFLALWAVLRWDTRRRVMRFLKTCASLDGDPALSLPLQTMEWLDNLLAPIQHHVDTVSDLAQRLSYIRQKIQTEKD